MSDDEALAKVRERMAEWQAYVAQPQLADQTASLTSAARDAHPSAELFDQAFDSTRAGRRSEVHLGRTAARSPRDAVGAGFRRSPVLYTQSESTITFSGLSSNVVEAPFGDAAYPSDDRLVVVLRDDGGPPDERAIHHAEVVDPDREQSRLLAEAIAREQMLIAREQAIRAQAIQASLETRDPVRTSYRVESRNSAWRRHEQDRHRWMVMALWMLMLAVCIAAVLIAFQLY